MTAVATDPTLPLDTTKAAAKPNAPVELRSGRDFEIVKQALTHRVDELDKLAKKTEEAGFAKEARAIRADADAIKHEISPKFDRQASLALVDAEHSLTQSVSTLVHERTRQLVVAMDAAGTDDKRQKKALSDFEEKLTAAIVARLQAAASTGFAEGEAYRALTPSEIAVRGLEALARSNRG